MRPATEAQWCEVLVPYRKVHLYTTDPGAHAVAVELWPLLRHTGQAGCWFAEGWSAAHAPDPLGFAEIARSLGAGELLLSGSQMDFARTRQSFAAARVAGASSGFVFDHWKNYREHFGDQPLPDLIVVPDALGHRLLLEAVGADASPRVRVLPLPSLEAAVDRVRSFSGAEPGLAALLLDPTEAADGLGYDWHSVLQDAVQRARREGLNLLVKPHPRQDAAQVRYATIQAGATPYEGDTEQLIARAQEVWGMTSLALITALQAGKPIRSFQTGRNPKGRQASNAHIEPFVV